MNTKEQKALGEEVKSSLKTFHKKHLSYLI